MANIVRWAGDTLRTAPFGFSLAAINLVSPVIGLVEDGPELSDLSAMPVSAFGLAMCGILVARQFRLRHRLERFVRNDGFNEAAFQRTTGEWCNRQTARVVCRNSGHLEEYEALCEQNPHAHLTRLPDL